MSTRQTSIGLMAAATLTLVACSQETLKMPTNDDSIQAGAKNMADKIEEYLNYDEPIKVKIGQGFAIRMESNPTTGYGWQLSKADEKVVQFVTNAYICPRTASSWVLVAMRSGRSRRLELAKRIFPCSMSGHGRRIHRPGRVYLRLL